jgi:ligand-binding sensor domain-containing protein
MIIQRQSIIAIGCRLALWISLATLLDGVAASQKKPTYFANHRVLKFHKAADHGGTPGLFINEANVILQDRADSFWVGSLLGLYIYDERRDQWVNFRQKQDQRFFKYVRVLCEDKLGRIWLKSQGSEIRFFDRGSWFVPEDLAPPITINKSRILFNGNNGNLWFVTGAGLLAFDGQRWTAFKTPPKDVEYLYDKLLTKYADQLEETLERNDDKAAREEVEHPKKDGNLKNANSLLHDISCGLQDRDGSIWLGARKAILKFDPAANSWQMFPLQGLAEALVIYEDRQGRIWFADEGGHLSIYNKKARDWKSYDLNTYFPQLQPQAITCVYQDRAGQVLIGIADVGLVLFIEKQNRWKILNEVNSDPPVYGVNAIFEDKLGRIWIGVREGILVLGQ